MKFAKELEHDAVPEWRIKYLNYKAGKKYVKSVARALNRANTSTPRSVDRSASTRLAAQRSRTPRHDGAFKWENGPHYDAAAAGGFQDVENDAGSQPISVPRLGEDQSLTAVGSKTLSYGSFVPTPLNRSPTQTHHDDGAKNFQLPAPAMRVSNDTDTAQEPVKPHEARRSLQRSTTLTHVPTSSPDLRAAPSGSAPKRGKSRSGPTDSPSQLRRLFSHSHTFSGRNQSGVDLATAQNLQSFDLVREREREFYEFMDSELDKVDGFYKLKEEQAGARLAVLREQLHEMRNRRIHELAQEQRSAEDHESETGVSDDRHDKGANGNGSGGWVQPIRAKMFPPGPNSRALRNMPQTPLLSGGRRGGDASRDYIRRPEDHDVSYRTAKHKLKLALQEFYRGLELLKSYALLNRTAFRKLNKKFDKAVNARPPYRYMNEKVSRSWFVTSDVLDGHIRAVEDLYARYFEKGNHKLAAGKLRSLAKRSAADESGSSFLNGFLLGTGIVFSVQGLVYGAKLLFDDDPDVRVHTSYLLQVYGGYFLMWMLFSLFCIDCFLWSKNKINYPFIFEFDQRHHLDWRRLSEFPSFFLLLFGVFMWVNFSRYGPEGLYLYYPVILIGATVFIILLPAPILAHRARKWFAYAHWRLLLAGFYPVEFRDFFLGDMYCSLTYATANVELFICLYAHDWNNPPRCNSSHSRAMGFLSTLPAIWRFLQCIRRYKDTRNIFPHLVNCGKYSMTILSYIFLSLYRLDGTNTHLALFVTFSTINGFYTSIWDLLMDFSLVQPSSRHFCLRDILALKRRWPYYFIMVVDPILRFSWIFYAIFTHNTQHSTIISFLVSLAEVVRRGMWALFRVENEHCANVSQYKASRDVPLPYRIEPLMDRASAESSPTIDSEEQRRLRKQQKQQQHHHHHQRPASADERQRLQRLQADQMQYDPESVSASSTAVPGSLAGMVRRRTDTTASKMDGPRSFSRILAEAHKQDFEKRRRPTDQKAEEAEGAGIHSDDDDEDDDGEGTDEDVREAADLRERGDSGR